MRSVWENLTLRGNCLVAAGVALVLTGITLGESSLLRAAVFALALPLVASLFVGRNRFRLSSTRSIVPSRTPVGHPATIALRVTNRAEQRSGLLQLDDGVPHVLGPHARFVVDRLAPGASVELKYELSSALRGRFAIGPLRLKLTDPFGLVERSRGFAATDVLTIVPVVHPLPGVGLGGAYSIGGDSSARSVSIQGEDDAATREFRSGDDLRKVHWRSTAWVGKLMVRREEQPWQSRATLLLDPRRRAHHDEGGRSSLEWAVEALASVAMHLSERGYAVRLARDDNARDGAHTWASGGGTGAGAHESAFVVLDQLATVGVGGEVELVRAVDDALANSGGLVVAALGQVDAADVAVLARLRQPRTSCVALCVPVPGGQPAAERRTLDFLRATGWDVVAASPGEPLAATWSRVGSLRPGAVRVQA